MLATHPLHHHWPPSLHPASPQPWGRQQTILCVTLGPSACYFFRSQCFSAHVIVAQHLRQLPCSRQQPSCQHAFSTPAFLLLHSLPILCIYKVPLYALCGQGPCPPSTLCSSTGNSSSWHILGVQHIFFQLLNGLLTIRYQYVFNQD